MDPETVRAWQRIGRDFAIVFLGAFMLIWQTVFATMPNPLLIGAGLILLGLPPALRLDDLVRPKRDSDDERAK